MKPRNVDLLKPNPKHDDTLRVQLAIGPGELQNKVKDLMKTYGLEQAAVCRMLMVDGLEARRKAA